MAAETDKGPERLHRREADKVRPAEEPEVEAPLFAEASPRLPASNAARAAMAERARAERGGAAVDDRAAAAAREAGIGDVSAARVHTGPEAAEAAAAVGARAFTVGGDIYFGAGQYAPGTAAGDRLLGHELAHTTQQRGAGPAVQAKLEVTDGASPAEAEADTAGDAFARAARGDAVRPVALGAAPLAIARDPLTSGATATAEITEEEILDDKKAKAAAAFNRGRHLPDEAWAKIATVVGAPGPDVDAAMARAVARFQKSQSFPVDGKVGDITLQRISQQPGGAGLEDLVVNDSILYLGLNAASRGDELSTLQGTGANVTGITGGKKQDTVKVDGKTLDLTDEDSEHAGLKGFIETFKLLDDGRKEQLRKFFESAGGDSKDELGLLARYFYQAEFGMRLIKRVVLSGHSGGWSIWGEENGTLSFDYLAKLNPIFPGATGQVEDLMLSACNTGQEGKIEQYRAIFPNVKTVWGYVGYSPSAATGSTRHIKEWEKATRGAADTDKLDAGRDKVAHGHGDKDQNVGVWSKVSGATDATYNTASPEAAYDYDTLKSTVDSALPAYHSAYDDGTIDQAALDRLYTQLQALVGNFASDLGDQREKYEAIMKRTLYLRHWSGILRNFMAANGDALKTAWGDGMPRDFGTASRAKVLGYIAGFAGDTTSDAYTQMVDKLKNLDNIPDGWN